MTRIQGVVVIAALFLVFGAAACGGSKSSSSSESEGTTSTTIGGTQVESHGTKDVSNESGKVEIELYDYYFEPTILKGKAGQKVELELKNAGSAAHTFTLAEQSVSKEIQPGDEAETEVTFPQSGQLKFVCTFHQSQGMIGAIQTSPGSSSSSTTTSKY
ncbi:MAG TPA: cupredoxin domain-containing protein [Gaiellaceae bacterium]|nr:cupredoxin domain-containing protein [Gaiellaceae bacterium]